MKTRQKTINYRYDPFGNQAVPLLPVVAKDIYCNNFSQHNFYFSKRTKTIVVCDGKVIKYWWHNDVGYESSGYRYQSKLESEKHLCYPEDHVYSSFWRDEYVDRLYTEKEFLDKNFLNNYDNLIELQVGEEVIHKQDHVLFNFHSSYGKRKDGILKAKVALNNIEKWKYADEKERRLKLIENLVFETIELSREAYLSRLSEEERKEEYMKFYLLTEEL